MIKIIMEGYECKRCLHRWIPRVKTKIPIACPKCNSPYWERERKNGK